MTVEIGKTYWTPWEPTGKFRVDEIHGPWANGFMVGDHPKGYKDGEVGAYLVSELEGREVRKET